MLNELKTLSDKLYISTADGSIGQRGTVVNILSDFLNSQFSVPSSQLMLYACGRKSMLEAVSMLAFEKKIKGYVSAEENDFEEIVFQEFPEIKKLKAELFNQGAQFALMSGTGSTVYGIFSNLQKAYWAEEYFKQNYFTYLNNPFTKGSIT